MDDAGTGADRMPDLDDRREGSLGQNLAHAAPSAAADGSPSPPQTIRELRCDDPLQRERTLPPASRSNTDLTNIR